MLGFNMLPVPSVTEAYALLRDSVGGYHQWLEQETMHMLSDAQLHWVTALAGFKTCYRLVQLLICHALCQQRTGNLPLMYWQGLARIFWWRH